MPQTTTIRSPFWTSVQLCTKIYLNCLISVTLYTHQSVKYHQQEHLAAQKQEHILHLHEHFVHPERHFGQLGLKQAKHFGLHPPHLGQLQEQHLGNEQQLTQLGFKHPGHLGFVQHVQENKLHFDFFSRRVCLILFSRLSVVMFSISWMNLQRWRM